MRSTFFDMCKRFVPQPKVETKEIEAYIEPIEKHDNEEEVEIEDEFVFVDFRKEPRPKKRGRAKGKRHWKSITGITLHQTAAQFGTNPRRLINVPAHGGVLKDGLIVLLHDPTDYMHHAHVLNKKDIGVEVSCRTAGILGNPDTFWLSKKEKKQNKKYEDRVSDPTEIQLEATSALCEYYIDLVAENGGKIKYIHPHRAGHSSRVGDPGSEIWKKVAIPLMEKYNLQCGPVGWAAGSGLPVPQVWDEINGEGIPYSSRIKGF